ncbi:hypothetical protein [Lacrimispora sp.]|uniref:hypothetical protein n=1 Tax=Lacrimispora sp. TaxID=2719234 RepID=UPI002FDB53C1
MEKNKQNQESEKDMAKEVNTFNNHWATGQFLGPNTLRHEKSREIYEEKDSE